MQIDITSPHPLGKYSLFIVIRLWWSCKINALLYFMTMLHEWLPGFAAQESAGIEYCGREFRTNLATPGLSLLSFSGLTHFFIK